jgi:hypothetical protein
MRLDIFEKRAKAAAEASGFNANDVNISVDPSSKMVAIVLSDKNQFTVVSKDLADTFYKAIRIIKGYGPKLTRHFKTKPGRKPKAEVEASDEA